MALTTNLQGYWAMDEASGTRADSTANANTLTDNNTVGSGTGIISLGADFELSNSEWLSRTNAAQVGLGITGDISFSFWFKPEQVSIEVGFIDKMRWGGSRMGYSVNMDNGNTFQIFFYDASSNLSRYFKSSFVSAGDIGNWIHVGISWISSLPAVGPIVYRNGSLQTMSVVSSLASTIGTNSNDFQIGRYNASNYVDGLMDEVGIWDRALSAAEILQLYNSGAGLAYPFTVATASASPFQMMGVG